MVRSSLASEVLILGLNGLAWSASGKWRENSTHRRSLRSTGRTLGGGVMLKHSLRASETNGPLILSVPVCHANQSAKRESEKVSQMSDGCGASVSELLRLSSQGSLWRRIPSTFSTMIEAAHSPESCERLPRSGMCVNGTLYALPTLVPDIGARESGSWPTPTSCDGKGASHPRHCKAWAKRGTNLPEAVNLAAAGDMRWPPPPDSVIVFDDNGKPLPVCRECLEPHGFTGPLNPVWVEWLMGFPQEWTDCGASETPPSLRSLRPLADQSCSSASTKAKNKQREMFE